MNGTPLSACPQFGHTFWLPDNLVLQALQFTATPCRGTFNRKYSNRFRYVVLHGIARGSLKLERITLGEGTGARPGGNSLAGDIRSQGGEFLVQFLVAAIENLGVLNDAWATASAESSDQERHPRPNIRAAYRLAA